nr:MAG TPA: Helix-turn-helix XRE-family like protein [Caudoviricetes sp.]
MVDKIIKNNIRELRKKRGLTQQQLADKLGISQVHG